MDGRKVENAEYIKDYRGEMVWRFGNFLREMCYEEAPFLPSADACVAICEASCAWQAPQLRMQVLFLGGHKDRESLLPGLSDQIKSSLCILPGDIDGNMHQIAFQLNSREDISRGLYAKATRIPSRTYGGRTRLHDYDEQQIWIHELDIATMYVDHNGQ